jgi:hypothetical protein
MYTKPLLFSLICLSASPAMAALSENKGISGEVSLSTAYKSTNSNFNTDANAVNTNNTTHGEQDKETQLLPLGSVAYTFGGQLDKQFYAGTSRSDIAIGTLALELGYKQQLENGTVIDASFLPTIMSGETWSDPFVTNQARQETDEKGNAYRLKLGNIANSQVSLDMAYAVKDIENERSGVESGLSVEQSNQLKRDSTSIYLKGDYKLSLNKTTFLIPSINYIKTNADGDANSFTSWGTELSLFKIINRHQLALTAGYKNRDYQASHPIYNKTRNDDEMSIFAAYEYKNIMNWQNWSLISFAGFKQSDSNIEFYDEDQWLVSVGLSHQF